MLKQGSQKRGPKVENNRPEPQSARAGSIQTHFTTFHKIPKYQEMSYLRLPISVIWVAFSVFLQEVARGLQGPPPSAKKIHKWKAAVPKWRPKVSKRYENIKLFQTLFCYISNFHNSYFTYFIYFVYFIFFIFIYIYIYIHVQLYVLLHV